MGYEETKPWTFARSLPKCDFGFQYGFKQAILEKECSSASEAMFNYLLFSIAPPDSYHPS